MFLRSTPVLQRFPGMLWAMLVMLCVGFTPPFVVRGQGFDDIAMEDDMGVAMAYSVQGVSQSAPSQPAKDAVGYELPPEANLEDIAQGVVPVAYAPPGSRPIFAETTDETASVSTIQRVPEVRHGSSGMKGQKAILYGSSHSGSVDSASNPTQPPGTGEDIGLGANTRFPHPPEQTTQPGSLSGHSGGSVGRPTIPVVIVQHMPPFSGTKGHS